MSSDNLDSGCSTCGSEKSDCEPTSRIIGLNNHQTNRSPPSPQPKKFGSSSSDSPSSSQESFAKILLNSSNSSYCGGQPLISGQMPEPKSPGGSSNASGGTPPVRLRKPQNSSAAANVVKFRFPAVAFFRKKKSWPNLAGGGGHVNGGSADSCSSELINNSLDLSNANHNLEFRMIKNLPRYSSTEYSDPEIRDSSTESSCRARDKVRKVNSREDPGPVRESVFCDPFSGQNLSSSSSNSTTKSVSCPSINNPPNGTKLKFIREGQIQICRLNHPRTVLGKLTSSKLLRRWESHFLVLDDEEITSKTVKN